MRGWLEIVIVVAALLIWGAIILQGYDCTAGMDGTFVRGMVWFECIQ